MGITRIPFIIGGIAILGACTGLFAKRFRPVTACLLAWLVQAPYIVVTDYVWFTYFVGMPQAAALGIITPIMVTLGLEAVGLRGAGGRHRALREESWNNSLTPCSLRI